MQKLLELGCPQEECYLVGSPPQQRVMEPPCPSPDGLVGPGLGTALWKMSSFIHQVEDPQSSATKAGSCLLLGSPCLGRVWALGKCRKGCQSSSEGLCDPKYPGHSVVPTPGPGSC